jgi:hypothetical protein
MVICHCRKSRMTNARETPPRYPLFRKCHFEKGLRKCQCHSHLAPQLSTFNPLLRVPGVLRGYPPWPGARDKVRLRATALRAVPNVGLSVGSFWTSARVVGFARPSHLIRARTAHRAVALKNLRPDRGTRQLIQGRLPWGFVISQLSFVICHLSGFFFSIFSDLSVVTLPGRSGH